MTTAAAITVLTEQEAVERLLARGWTRESCAACRGVGHFVDTPETFLEEKRAKTSRICDRRRRP